MSVLRFLALNTLILLLLPGCNAFNLNLTFSHIDELKKGDGVIFEKTLIGHVKKISYNDQHGFSVTIDIKKDFTSALTEFSRFEIAPSPLQPGEQAIIVTLVKKGGALLQAGTMVKAQPPSAFEPLNPMWDKIQSGFENFINDMRDIPESDEFQRFENKLDELGRDMKNSGQSIRDNIQNNILPRLKEELDALREKFTESGEPDKIKPLEKKLENLQEI